MAFRKFANWQKRKAPLNSHNRGMTEILNSILPREIAKREAKELQFKTWMNSALKLAEIDGYDILLHAQDCTDWLSITTQNASHRSKRQKGITIGWNGERFSDCNGAHLLAQKYPTVLTWIRDWCAQGCPA